MAEHPAKSDQDVTQGASLAELTTEIVSAYVAHNALATSDLARLIGVVAAELRAVGREPESTSAKVEPAVPIRRSIQRDRLTCLICGKRQKMLRRHLGVAHGLTPADYREMFGLKPDYPMVAPSYSEERAELARKIGLGGLRKKGAPRRRRQARGSAAQST
jgi:predicted transcriptional regulator